jgi:hypothetical protein
MTDHNVVSREEWAAAEHLVEPLHLARSLVGLGLAVAGQVAQLAERPRRHERGPREAVADRLADPLGVPASSYGRRPAPPSAPSKPKSVPATFRSAAAAGTM